MNYKSLGRAGWRDERPATAEHRQMRAEAVPAQRGVREPMSDWDSCETMCIFLRICRFSRGRLCVHIFM